MKTRLLSVLSLLLLVFTTSCSFTENITIKDDGSGDINFDMDGSAIMAMMGDEIMKGSEKRVDSTMAFKDLFAMMKDSIDQMPKEQQERLKKLENFNMKMLMDPETQEFRFALLTDFKRIEDIGDLMESFNDANPMNSKIPEGTPDFGFDKYKTNTKYTYTGKKFTKTVSRQAELPKPEEGEEEPMEMVRSMLESSTYTLNYTFPKRIKSVSDKTATISADRKTVTVIHPFSDYLEKPALLSIEVEFE